MEHSEELKQDVRDALMTDIHKDEIAKILKCSVCGIVIADHPKIECPEEQSKLEIVKENEENIAKYIKEVLSKNGNTL